MDTSKKYIKMCEEAKEIQNLSPICVSEWSRIQANPDIYIDKAGNLSITREFTIWLPRQDQLQKMVGKLSIIILLDEFYEFLRCDYYDSKGVYWYFDTIEQLWLAFVMKEKYSKTWSSEEWIKFSPK